MAASAPNLRAAWAQPSRAAELRRRAEALEAVAPGHAFPERVRRLARDCRLRAVELEVGADPPGRQASGASGLGRTIIAAR